ncbi:hypothetical protein CDQ84_04280 [Clostridium thermosuccinogenes]|uniref:Uncharacterized protein n=1 Tax=Clostridium thermosuccinogenes TaxID=84032 RepID=A0A2K2FJK3_9CLOT|nr:hypothetical protein CDO33_19025 [Pseudoclostridium thermosuccinogenes]PNT98957.1 hypothetical protein CDQ85_04235 [Pseudoclostridium thermosuccinogenes]PNU00872.1 hypothetical protein CDQ84_04280 [Pseudoclostridium thermosuccinogenes]
MSDDHKAGGRISFKSVIFIAAKILHYMLIYLDMLIYLAPGGFCFIFTYVSFSQPIYPHPKRKTPGSVKPQGSEIQYKVAFTCIKYLSIKVYLA